MISRDISTISFGYVRAKVHVLRYKSEMAQSNYIHFWIATDPENYGRIKNSEEPSNDAKLCQYVQCGVWMSNTIPPFVERAAPLYRLLKEAYRKGEKRTKKAISCLNFKSLEWGERHSAAFTCLQDHLKEVFKTAHPNPDKQLWMNYDANELFWVAPVTHCSK